MLRRSVTVDDQGLHIDEIGILSFKNFKHIDVNPSKPNIIITLDNDHQLQLTPINGYSKSAKSSFFKFLEHLEKVTAANMT